MMNHRLQRIAQAALERAQPSAWALLAVGVAALLLLPLASKKCYLDEKALLVGGAQPTVRQSGAFRACMEAYQHALPSARSGDTSAVVGAASDKVAAALRSAGPPLAFYRHNFTSAGSSTCSRSSNVTCSTWHTVVRSPRGDGSEGFVLLIPLDASGSAGGSSTSGSGQAPAAAAMAAAVGLAAAAHLRQSGWLAKDAVLVFVDAACGGGALEGAQEWLSAYNSASDLFSFPRAGLLQQALVLEMTGASSAAASSAGAAGAAMPGSATAELSVHGSSGQLPNLDLYYLIKRNLDMHAALPISLRASSAPLPAWAQRTAAGLGGAAAAAGLASPAAAQRYAAELSTLVAFSVQLASGAPTGPHAPFLSQQIDAATLSLRVPALSHGGGTSGGSGGSAAQPSPQLRLASASTLSAAEMCLRTFNNLQERLHHSTALYVLLSPDRFFSIAAYLAPPGCLLLAALAQLVAASRAAAGAPRAAWHAAWRRVAAAHAAAFAGSAASSWLHGNNGWLAVWRLGSMGSSLLPLAEQLAWAALLGLAVAEGPAALLGATTVPGIGSNNDGRDGRLMDSSNSSRKGSKGVSKGSGDGECNERRGSSEAAVCRTAASSAVQQCTTAVALAAVILQGSHLLMGQWARCFAFLLPAALLHALASGASQAGSTALGALRRAGSAAALVAAAWQMLSGGSAAWIASLLLPHLFLSLA